MDFVKLCKGKEQTILIYCDPSALSIIEERKELVDMVKRYANLDGRDAMMIELLAIISDSKALLTKIGE
jgi:hypothetical protein